MENVITLKNGDKLTIEPLVRGKRKLALRNLAKRGIEPSVSDLKVLNGIELQTELAYVCWTTWSRSDGTVATDKERRVAIDDSGDVLTDTIVGHATKLADALSATWEVEEKNS